MFPREFKGNDYMSKTIFGKKHKPMIENSTDPTSKWLKLRVMLLWYLPLTHTIVYIDLQIFHIVIVLIMYNCLGALDDTYIKVHVLEVDKPKYRNRKN